jgi:hypothetical protein
MLSHPPRVAALVPFLFLPLALSLTRCVGDDAVTSSTVPPPPPAEAGGSETSSPVDASTADTAPGAETGADAGPPKAEGKLLWGDHFATQGSAFAVAMDSGGNAIVAVRLASTAAVMFGTTSAAATGAADIVIVKLSPTGTVVWANHFTGAGDETARAVTVDASNDVYVAGQFDGASVSAGNGKSATRGGVAVANGFVAKLAGADGTAKWMKGFTSTSGTGGASCTALSIRPLSKLAFACDFQGNLSYDSGTETGTAGSAVLLGTIEPSSGTVSASSMLRSSSAATAAERVNANGIDVDDQGSLYVGGNTHANNLYGRNDVNPISGSSRMGSESGFVAKVATGGGVAWVRIFGPDAGNPGFAVTQALRFDPVNKAVYVAGNFVRANFGKGEQTSAGGGNNDDAYVLRLDASGGGTTWQKLIGNAASADEMNGITVDAWGQPLVTGTVTAAGVMVDGKDLPAGFGFFALKLEPTGGVAQWALGRTCGGSVSTSAIAVAPSGASTIVGRFDGTLDLVSPQTSGNGGVDSDTYAAGISP